MIIVTGGAGFIGSVLVKKLNERGYDDILIVDRLESDEKWRNLQGLDYYDFMHADDLFSGDHDELWEEVTAIYHMGACSSTTERDVDFLWENNVRYTQALIFKSYDYDIPIIYASSAATYGDGDLGYSDSHESVKKLRPLNAYGFSKQYVDQWLIRQKEKPSVWYGVKFFNVFGPNEYHKDDMSSLVFKAYHQIKDKGEVKLFKSHRDDYKDGEQLRDFVYVKDAAEAVIQLMEKKATSGIYNIGTGQARSFLDLVKATFKAMNVDENVTFIDMPESIRDQYQYYTQAEVDKLKGELSDFKYSSLEDAVADYVKEHLEQKDPYY